MINMIERWVDLPVGAKAGLIVLTGGGLMSAAYFLIRDPQVIIVIGIGLALLAGLILGYRWIIKKRKAKKSKPFEDEIVSSGGSTPREVSDPSRRAQVDSLRKKFEEGLRVYRQRGKDLYSLPWYVVIGEPGSGKSAAIRNSGVGFPPGLQEEMQGVGGTINMDWFFTNDAVVLDTAGRLAFEEVDIGKTTEWKEFLRLLRVARPRCPINGMMLFIPADSLKNDTADELEQKGSKIAQQLDFMQQTLGVRFPLFVIISKADLLVGFSEFFEGIADPREQFQIFGWSNPNSLDTPFQPREIQGVLGEIRERIFRRRALLLKEPAPQTLVANRRIDEVDRMYLLPDETERIAPRLERYLELIFAGGQWASPPPFLRGVYFTSALREGEAVDMALAEAIGAEASDALEDRRWDTKRSFFLHDVFMEKVFRERGLVTAAPSPSRAKRSRRTLLLGAISAILLVSIGLTGYSAYQFWHDLKGPEAYWNKAESKLEEMVNVSGVQGVASFGMQGVKPIYFGAEPIEFGSTKTTHATLPKVLADRITTKKIRAGGIFALFGAVKLVPDLERPQWDAQRAVLNATVVSPLLRGSLDRLADESVETWTEEATAAYTAVLGVWTRSLDEKPRGGTTPSTAEEDGGGATTAADADSLFPYGALSSYFLVGAENSDQLNDYSLQRGAVEEAISDAFGAEGGNKWRPGRDEFAEADIVRATESFLAHRTITRAPQARALVALADTLAAYRSAEQGMLSTDWFTTSTSWRLFDEDRRRWNEQLDELERLAGELELARQAAEAQGLDLNADPGAVVRSAAVEAANWVSNALDLALLSLPEYKSGDSGDSEEQADGTEGIARRLEARRLGLGQDPVAELNDELGDLAGMWGNSLVMVSSKPKYVWRLEAYQQVGSSLKDADLSVVSTISELRSLERGLADTRIGLVEASSQGLTGDAVMRDSDVLGSVARAGELARRYQIATEILDRFGEEIAIGVEKAANEDIKLAGIDVRGTSLVAAYTVDRRFDPVAAVQVFEAWSWLAEITKADGEVVVLGRSALSQSLIDRLAQLNGYLDAYLGYWGEAVPSGFQVTESLTWSEYRVLLPNVSSGAINDILSEVAKVRVDAIKAVPSGVVGDRASLVAELRNHAADAYTECKSDGFRSLTGRVRTSWNRLSNDASRARRELLEMDPGELADGYLAHATEVSARSSIGFWDSLVEGMILSIASDAGAALSDGNEEVRLKLRSRPFCLTAQSSLTSADIAGLAASIESLLGSAGQNDGGEFGESSLGAGGGLDIPRMDDAIRTLRGAAPQLDPDRRRRLETAGAIAAWLEKEPEVVIRTLALGHIDTTNTVHQTQVLKYLTIDGESLLTGNRGSFTTPVTLPQAEGLTLRFSTTQDGGADRGTVVLPAPWGILQLLTAGEPDPNPTEDEGKEWQVQVRVAGTDARIWIGLTFSEPLAIDPSDWPDCGGGE